MIFKRLSASFSAAPQVTEADIAAAAQAGFGAIIDNRPDGFGGEHARGAKPSPAAWSLKARVLPSIYWDGILKGRESMAHPHAADGHAA